MLSYRHASTLAIMPTWLKHLVPLQTPRPSQSEEQTVLVYRYPCRRGTICADSAEASRNAEHADGIGGSRGGRLPDAARDYVELVRAFNRDQDVRYYPGSPVIA